jgi:hypothetical protein
MPRGRSWQSRWNGLGTEFRTFLARRLRVNGGRDVLVIHR